MNLINTIDIADLVSYLCSVLLNIYLQNPGKTQPQNLTQLTCINNGVTKYAVVKTYFLQIYYHEQNIKTLELGLAWEKLKHK